MEIKTIACIIANALIIIGFTGGFRGWRQVYHKMKDKSTIISKLDIQVKRAWNAFHQIFVATVFIITSLFIELTNTSVANSVMAVNTFVANSVMAVDTSAAITEYVKGAGLTNTSAAIGRGTKSQQEYTKWKSN